MATVDQAPHLRRCTLFRDLGAAQLGALARRCQIRAVRKGEVLFSQGDDSDCLYVVVEGSATISLLSEAGRELIFHIARPGDSIGEIALLDGHPRSATCTVRDSGRMLVLRRTDFLALLADPALARGIISVLCTLLRRSTERAEFLALRPLRARLARVLVANANPGKTGAPELRLTQQELAQMCGAARPRVNQTLKQLETDGVIAKDGRTIVLCNTGALAAIAQELDEA